MKYNNNLVNRNNCLETPIGLSVWICGIVVVTVSIKGNISVKNLYDVTVTIFHNLKRIVGNH